jgi:molecular chaperone DnaK
MIYETKDLVLKTIAEAENDKGEKMDVDDIDRLVLVGGSTKIPLVARVLADTVKEPFIADNVDLAVSSGAAILAANLYAVQESGQVQVDYAPVEVNVRDVTAHPISVGLADAQDQLRCEVVIQKNALLPSAGMTMGVAQAGMRIGRLPVFRGEDPIPEKNHYLGVLTLTFDSSPVPTFIRFELSLDKDGVLQVEGAIIDLERHDPAELQWLDPKDLKVKRKVRAEIKLPD